MNEPNLINELQKKNQELLGKLAILQKQFDDAIEITNAFDSVSSKNAQLEKDIRCLQSKNDDLNRRIQILSKSNGELIQKNEDEKRQISSQSQADISELSEKLRKMQCEHEKQLLQIQFQNKESEQNFSSQITILEKKLQKIYDASTQFFGISISDVDGIITQMLTKSCCSKEDLSHQTASIQTQDQIKLDYENKEKRLKSKIRSLKEQSQQLQTLNSDQKNIIENLENEKNELCKSNESLKEKIITIQKSHNESQNVATRQIKDAKSHCNKLKAKLVTTTQNTEFLEKQNAMISEQINEFKAKLQEKDAKISSLMNELQQLQRNLNKSEKNATDSDEIIRNSQKTIADLKTKCQELSALSEQNKAELDDAKFEAKNKKKALQTMQKLMNDQNQDIIKMQSQRLQLISHIQKVNSTLSSYETYIAKILSTKRDPLPPTSFKYPQFPCEINESVFSIAYNQNIKDEDKLQSIYSIIYNYYTNQIKSLNEMIQTYKTDIQAKDNRMESILNELNKRIQQSIDNEIKQNELKNAKKDNEATNQVPYYIQFNNQYPNCNQMNTKLPDESHPNSISPGNGQNINQFPNTIQGNSQLPNTQFQATEQIKNPCSTNTYNNYYNPNICDDKLKKAEETISEYKDKLEKLKEKHQKLIEQAAEKDYQLNELFRMMQVTSLDDAKTYLNTIKNTSKDLQSKLQNEKSKHKKMIKEKQIHLDEIQDKLNEMKNTLEKTEKQLHENEATWEIEKQQLEDENKELRSTANKMKDRAKQYSEKIVNLKADTQSKHKANQDCQTTIESQKRELAKKDAIIQQLRLFTKYYSKKQSEKHNSEQELLKTQLNDIIQQLKTKNCELKQALNEVKEKMNLSEKQYSKAKRQIAVYCSKIQELEIKLEAFHNDAERGKSLCESKSKAVLIAQEAQYQSHLEESKFQIENAKRELMASVALQFSSYFNANATINSANFEVFLQQLRQKFDKLTKMENKIRSMLSLKPDESIETAISILLSNQNL